MMNDYSQKILVVCAHPDDETLWFSSVALRNSCDLVCVTCGSPMDQEICRNSLERATRLLGYETVTVLDHPDISVNQIRDLDHIKRLDLKKLEEDLLPFARRGYRCVYTHGPYGEVNEHPHHQDVAYVVRKMFPSVKMIAWNLFPDEVNQLSSPEYTLKKTIMGTVYYNEYCKLKKTYQVSPTESFIELSAESVELYYWSIANFGDHHALLGNRFVDMWGYRYSPYERERHARIVELARQAQPSSILELGAHEGVLSEQLSKLGKLSCTETSLPHRKVLQSKGFRLIDKVDSAPFDLVVLASVLEYCEKPEEILKKLRSQFVIVSTIMGHSFDKVAAILGKYYKVVSHQVVVPRWESMFHGCVKEKLEVYRLGADVVLYERR
jgi:LmbE family N-acetylglucosaminyl deacetylase